MKQNNPEFMKEFGKEDIASIIDVLKGQLGKKRIMTFTGPLGAGKTTLVKALLRAYGISETVTSPTFTYVNKYTNAQGDLFYHFDLYRIKSMNDFLGMGFDEYLHDPRAYVLIEWPEIIEPLLRDQVCHISLDYAADERERSIRIK